MTNKNKKKQLKPVLYKTMNEKKLEIEPMLRKVQELDISNYDSVKELIRICLDFVSNQHTSTINGKIYFPEGHRNFEYYLNPTSGIDSYINMKYISD
jgi:ribosomal protein L1